MANPTEEDLRVAAEIADGSVVRTPTPHMSREKLVSRIASMRAAEREKAAKIAEAGNCKGSDPFAGIAAKIRAGDKE